MNTNSKFVWLMLVVVGWMLASQDARSEDVYNNTNTRQSPALFLQSDGNQLGDEISLFSTNTWGYRFITNFAFEYFGTGFGGGEQARLRFYANDGTLHGTNYYGDPTPFYDPGTLLFDSGLFSIGTTPDGSATLIFSGLNLGLTKGVIVPSNFTWTVEFVGIGAGESAGLTLLNPPTVGSSYPDYWENDGGDWTLRTTNGAPDALNFGAYAAALVDNIKPVPAFTLPKDKFRCPSNTVTIVGKPGSDKSGIALVFYRIGHTLYGTNAFTLMPSPFAPYWTNYNVPLRPGTNYFQVKSVDGSGNESLIKTLKIQHVVTSNVTVIATGTGTNIFYKTNLASVAVLPLEINADYTLTAKNPGNRFYIFSNWLQSVEGGATNVVSASAVYKFNAKSNMVIIADFQTNRFTAIQGNYYGLFFDEETPMVSHERAGFFTMTIKTNDQKFTGKLTLDGNTVPFSGVMNLEGYGVSKVMLRKGKSSLQTTVQLNFDGSDTMTGSVICLSNTIYAPQGPFTSSITAYRATYNFTDNPATNLYGTYTMAIDIPADSLSPKGYGYGLVTMKSNGAAVATGFLGDYATHKSILAPISKHGEWPFYASTYKGDFVYIDPKTLLSKTNKEMKGSIIGWLKFTNTVPNDPTSRTLLDNASALHWIKTANTNFFYPAGFTNHDLGMSGSVFNAPTNAKTTRVLSITNGLVANTGGNIPVDWTNTFVWNTNNAIKVDSPSVFNQTVSVTPKTGQMKTSFNTPIDPLNQKRYGLGAVLQDENIALGVFKGTNATGSFIIHSTD